MFCSKCGTEMPDDSEFCKKCGTKLPTGSAVPQSEVSQTNATKKSKKKKSKLPIIVVAAVLLVVVIVVVSSGSGGGHNIDYIATAKAHMPFATSQNLPYTYAEVFDKYTTNPIWYIDTESEETDTAIVKVDGTVKGTEYGLIVSIKVSPNPDDPDGCLIQPQSVNFDGIESVSQGNVADFLYIMFAAYDEEFADLSEVLSNLDEVSGLLTGSGITGQQADTELSQTYASTNMGISFRYPSSWELFDFDDSVSITNNTIGRIVVFEVINVSVFGVGMVDSDIFSEDIAALEESLSQQENITISSIEDTTINGVPARLIKSQSQSLDSITIRDYYYFNGDNLYHIRCGCSESVADTYEKVFDAIIDSFSITPTEVPVTAPSQSVDSSAPPKMEPPQENGAFMPFPSDYVGTWVNITSTYEMSISYEDDGTYIIGVSRNLSDNEWRQWYLDGYGDGGGIFYSGGYIDLYLRDDGTVDDRWGEYTETNGFMYITADGSLYWNDSVLGLPELQFTKQ